MAIFDALDTAELMLKVYPPMIRDMRVKRENMARAAADPALMATDLAEKLVELGVPFRDAHHRVGAFVKYCKDRDCRLDQVTLEEMHETIPEATPEFLDMFDARKSIAKRRLPGGTGFEPVREQLAFWQKRFAESL